jgi:hypothetical protein
MLNLWDLTNARPLVRLPMRLHKQLPLDQSRQQDKPQCLLQRMTLPMMRVVPLLVPFLALLLDFARGFLACLDFRIRQSAH